MPGKLYGAATDPSKFMPLLAQQVADSVDGLKRDRVFRSNYEPAFHLEFPPADRFVTLFLSDFPVGQPGVSGGGRITTTFNSKLEVNAFVRLEADIEGRSTSFFEDQAAGQDAFVHAVIGSLQMWDGPLDDDGATFQFVRPARLDPGYRVVRKTVNGPSGPVRWCYAQLTFEIGWRSKLDAYPGS